MKNIYHHIIRVLIYLYKFIQIYEKYFYDYRKDRANDYH